MTDPKPADAEKPEHAEKKPPPPVVDAAPVRRAQFVLPRVVIFLAAAAVAAYLGWRYSDYAFASVAAWLAVAMLPMRGVVRLGVVVILLTAAGSMGFIVAVDDDTDYRLGRKTTLIAEPVKQGGISATLDVEPRTVEETRPLPGLVMSQSDGPWDLRLHLLDHGRGASYVVVRSAKVIVNGQDIWLYGQPDPEADSAGSEAGALDPTRQAAFGSPMVGDRVIEQAPPIADVLLGTFRMPDGITGPTSLKLVVELEVTAEKGGGTLTYEFDVTHATIGYSDFVSTSADE